MVWEPVVKDGITTHKGRAAADVRRLNRLYIKDTSPLLLQSDIITALLGRRYITVIDAVSFFHQELVPEGDRHKFTANTSESQVQLNVAMKGLRIIQREPTRILRDERDFCCACVDDIVIFSTTPDERTNHLDTNFGNLLALDVTISRSEPFISYPSTVFLGQRVNRFGLVSHEEKMALILDLEFPNTMTKL